MAKSIVVIHGSFSISKTIAVITTNSFYGLNDFIYVKQI